MLRQQETISYKEPRKFEDLALYQKEIERMPIEQAMGWSVVSHGALALFVLLLPLFLLVLFGINLDLFNKVKPKARDIEFVLVNQPEEEPINKKTPLRADRNTRAGGIHDPHKKIAPPQQALPKSAPSQQGTSKPKQVKEKTIFEKVFAPQPTEKKANPVTQQPVQKTQQKVTQPQPQTQPQQVVKPVEPPKTVQPKPLPPKPMAARPSIPPTKAQNTMKLPIPPSNGAPRISTASSSYGGGPVSSRPSGSYSGGSTGMPKPVMASGGYGQTARIPSNSGSGRGSAYSPGGGNVGNPGPGNPHGRPGVDAIKEPNFGPYMSELSRRIKSNWDPPRGDESKRVVLFFKIAKDGRLLNVKVLKSSGTAAADKAAMAAVELTAPFRPLPAEYRESSIDIQFTFDYNVFGVNRY